ncbi:MAG: hypothetical protein E7553_01830 [Ruminococcaceae bacterium]|nr:hypothetical protein [Oscillospiraceae bacterium]
MSSANGKKPKKDLRWMPLDNAAKIYPAARNQHWSNIFRLSATLYETVDTAVLQRALNVTVPRFPSIAVRLRRGIFWYYLQELSAAPNIREEYAFPLIRMSKKETRECAFRVIVYQNRIAVEFFHSLTDGNGGLIFLKTLLAEYLEQKHGITIPAENGVLDRREAPKPEETEDCFLKAAGPIGMNRRENISYRLTGTPEHGERTHITCLRIRAEDIRSKAHEYGVSVTAFLCAVTIAALQNLQNHEVSEPKKRKPIRVLIPVNLRSLFPSGTLRNFALYTTPEILPALGQYSFEEICTIVKHRMGLEINRKHMSMKIATNVRDEQHSFVRAMPLFIKNIVMKAVFNAVGERTSSLSLSNLGVVRLPAAMDPYVDRLDFILGVQATAPYNCGIITYKDRMNIHFIRNIREPFLENAFYNVLKTMHIPVVAESN